MKAKILAGVVLALGVVSLASASSIVTERGFKNCESELTSEFRNEGLVLDRAYLVKKRADSTTYYINGNVWDANGNRQELRTSCVTDSGGNNITALTTDSGRYVAGSSVAIR